MYFRRKKRCIVALITIVFILLCISIEGIVVTADENITVGSDSHIISRGIYYLKNARTGRFVDFDNNASSPYVGSKLEQWDFNRNGNQGWVIVPVTSGQYNGYYTIYARSIYGSGALYLTVKDNSSANDADVILSYYNGGAGQYWKIEATSNGRYKIIPACGEANNRVLCVNDSLFGSTGNGLDIKSRTYTNDGNYKDEWEIYDIYNYAHLSLNARIYYDSTVTYSASYISSMYHDATEIFSTIYSIRFNLEAITYANELNCSSACHSTALNDICNESCGKLNACSSVHHRGAERLVDLLRSDSYYTYRLVGYGVCKLVEGKHDAVVGCGYLNGKDSISCFAFSPNMTNSIQHELTHNLGGDHSTCVSGQSCTLKGDFNGLCDNCRQLVEKNY